MDLIYRDPEQLTVIEYVPGLRKIRFGSFWLRPVKKYLELKPVYMATSWIVTSGVSPWTTASISAYPLKSFGGSVVMVEQPERIRTGGKIQRRLATIK